MLVWHFLFLRAVFPEDSVHIQDPALFIHLGHTILGPQQILQFI